MTGSKPVSHEMPLAGPPMPTPRLRVGLVHPGWSGSRSLRPSAWLITKLITQGGAFQVVSMSRSQVWDSISNALAWSRRKAPGINLVLGVACLPVGAHLQHRLGQPTKDELTCPEAESRPVFNARFRLEVLESGADVACTRPTAYSSLCRLERVLNGGCDGVGARPSEQAAAAGWELQPALFFNP